MRYVTSGTTTPRELRKPSVLGMLEKLEGCMTDVLATLKDVKEAVSAGQLADQWSAVKKVEDPADELREMAESRAKAWLAENSAADAWMAELKEFEESRENNSGAESMLTCSEVELLTEERTHAGIVSPSQILRERSSMRQESQREVLDKMDATIWNGLQDAGDESDSLRARLEQVESQVTQLPERIKGEIRAEALDATSVDEKVTALARQLDEKVLAFSKQLAEAAKKLKAREEDCDFLRAAGSRLQARTGQLEARLDTEIEQLNDELAGLEEAGSAMRTVESRCMEMLKVHQRRMDAEFVRLQECNMKASQKFDQLLAMLQGT